MYKVCILAAGKNNRVKYSELVNNALLPVGHKSAISRIIEKFPKDVEIVIPLGYKAQQVKDYLAITHPDRLITFVEVENWDGPGSGPGLSLLSCKPHLNCPFIFTSCDTLVAEDIPKPTRNWIGVAPVKNSQNFCISEVVNDRVIKFFDKFETEILLQVCLDYKTILDNAFIGMAGVKNYKEFWEGLEESKSELIKNELQVSNGLNTLIEHKLEAIPFTWYNTGDQNSYEITCINFSKNKVLPKLNEFIYFENNKVIKYFANPKSAKDRVDRANLLKGIVPEITLSKPHFYAYEMIEGKMLSETFDQENFKNLLKKQKETLWKEKELTDEQKIKFKEACKNFIEGKTKSRIKDFYLRTGIQDEEETINGVRVPTMASLLERIDWDRFCEGVPVLFHGDFQPENIIMKNNGDSVLIDWRHDFGGILEFGDIYYDFAKLEHALIINGEIIRRNEFFVKKKGNQINFNYLAKGNLLRFRKIFHNFIKANNYDLYKVKVLGALHFPNIAPLHHTPYNIFLYYLGKLMLFELLEEKNENRNTTKTISNRNGTIFNESTS